MSDTIETVTRYRVYDEEFQTEEQAQARKAAVEACVEANAAWDGGCTLGELRRRWPCDDSTGWVWGVPTLPELLEPLTAQTLIIISHWQCNDKPAYKLTYIECGRMGDWHFHAGGRGGWMGFYGQRVTLTDLARYVERGTVEEASP